MGDYGAWEMTTDLGHELVPKHEADWLAALRPHVRENPRLPVSSWQGVVVLQLFFEALWTQKAAVPMRGGIGGVTFVTARTGLVLAGDLRLYVSFVSHNRAVVNTAGSVPIEGADRVGGRGARAATGGSVRMLRG